MGLDGVENDGYKLVVHEGVGINKIGRFADFFFFVNYVFGFVLKVLFESDLNIGDTQVRSVKFKL